MLIQLSIKEREVIYDNTLMDQDFLPDTCIELYITKYIINIFKDLYYKMGLQGFWRAPNQNILGAYILLEK